MGVLEMVMIGAFMHVIMTEGAVRAHGKHGGQQEAP